MTRAEALALADECVMNGLTKSYPLLQEWAAGCVIEGVRTVLTSGTPGSITVILPPHRWLLALRDEIAAHLSSEP